MTRGSFIATGLGLALLALLGLVANDRPWDHLRQGPPAQSSGTTEPVRKARSRDGGATAPGPGGTAAETRLANWRNYRVTLPESVVEAMQMNAFDETSGELSPALLEALGVNLQDRKKLAAATAALLDSFQELEMQTAEVRDGGAEDPVDQRGDFSRGRYLLMLPCEEAARPLLEDFRAEMEGLLGKDRGEMFFLLTRKNLRHGGRDGMWAGYGDSSGSRRVCFGGYAEGRMGYPNIGGKAADLKEMRRYRRLAALLER